MANSDIANAIIIIIIFAAMQLTITLSIGIARIKKNWDEYKCNPAIIPFANVFDQDPLETFNQCVQESQAQFMSTFLTPIYSAIATLTESGSLFSGIFEFLKTGLNANQLGIFNLAQDIGARVTNLISALNVMFINVTDVFGKLSTTITVVYYILISAINTGKALWDELPGTAIKFVTSIIGG